MKTFVTQLEVLATKSEILAHLASEEPRLLSSNVPDADSRLRDGLQWKDVKAFEQLK